MNLFFSEKEKFYGFAFFFFLAMLCGYGLFMQAAALKYPFYTALTFAVLPVVIRVIFNYSELMEVLHSEQHNSDAQRTDSNTGTV